MNHTNSSKFSLADLTNTVILVAVPTLLVSCLAGCAEDVSDAYIPKAAQIAWQGQQPGYASKVMPLFQKQCAQLLGYSQDIESIKAMEWESYDFEKERGWADKAIVIDIKIKTDGVQIPSSLQAWGHTCTYKIDANGKEMSATKEPCAQLCNMPSASTANSYISF